MLGIGVVLACKLEPIGIIEGKGYIEYTHGMGFDSQLPEFHGHISNGVTHVPAFCAFCVYDEELNIVKWVKQ